MTTDNESPAYHNLRRAAEAARVARRRFDAECIEREMSALSSEWNAAIDAAAKDLDEYAQDSIDAAESITLNAASERIRALKRVTP